ncbi:hypothetical protein BDR22DRAFT_884761 [Usnea florida]
MSRLPYVSNEPFPWPDVHSAREPISCTATDQPALLSGLRRGSSQQSVHTSSFSKQRGRAYSDARAVLAKPQVRGRSRSTNFGSTQEYENVCNSPSAPRLELNLSQRKVQELVKLRKLKLREAERRGDQPEIVRLKNLNLFDDIEKDAKEGDEPKGAACTDYLSGPIDHRGFTSQLDGRDVDFAPQSKQPKPISQGHTATLCWHLKLQYAQGLTVPAEFSQCDIHPTPSPCIFSTLSPATQSALPNPLSSESTQSKHPKKVSSIGSSTLIDTSKMSSPATSLSTSIAPGSPSPTKQSATTTTTTSSLGPNPDETDPFLYIAKYIQRHAKRGRQSKEAKHFRSQAPTPVKKRASQIPCKCANHSCNVCLSGSPSKHCRLCKLPGLIPEIAAAADRIEEMKTSSSFAHVDTNFPPAKDRPSEADEVRRFEALQEDVRLVEMYCAEMEKRCSRGVWWEGWLIVRDLKRKGIVGSKPAVDEKDEAAA